MTDYKGMYIDLFKSVTEAVEILKQAQAKAENTYIDTSTADYELMTESELADIVNHKKQSWQQYKVLSSVWNILTHINNNDITIEKLLIWYTKRWFL